MHAFWAIWSLGGGIAFYFIGVSSGEHSAAKQCAEKAKWLDIETAKVGELQRKLVAAGTSNGECIAERDKLKESLAFEQEQVKGCDRGYEDCITDLSYWRRLKTKHVQEECIASMQAAAGLRRLFGNCEAIGKP